jgi:hypothetical protein
MAVLAASPVCAQEGVFLSEEQAPAAVFPDADHFARLEVESTPELRARMRAGLGGVQPSLWEERYVVFTATRGTTPLGHALIVEEIGKHRPITFAVGVNADGTLHDAAVLAYREAYGGEVRERRFLRQLAGHSLGDPLLPQRDLINIAGATLSVAATGRAARKAIAVLKASGALT